MSLLFVVVYSSVLLLFMPLGKEEWRERMRRVSNLIKKMRRFFVFLKVLLSRENNKDSAV